MECVKQEAVFTASLYWPCRWSSCLPPEGTPGTVAVALAAALGLQTAARVWALSRTVITL